MSRYTRVDMGGFVFLALLVLYGTAQAAQATPTEATLAELQTQINQIRLIVDDLDKRIQALVASRGQTHSASLVMDMSPSTVVAGSKAAALGAVMLDATKAAADSVISSITLMLEAPEDNSQKGLFSCQLRDGPSVLAAGVNPSPSKNDTTNVTFPFINQFTISKGTHKTLTLACDVTQNPEGLATYTWQLGSAFSKKTLLISSGSFVLDVAASSPAARAVKGGAKGEVATVFDFYAAGEAVELKTLALQIDGNPRAVTAYSLWDDETQVGGGALSGDSVFKAAFTAPFEIPKDEHKLLTLKVDLASIVSGGFVQEGDHVAVNFDGSNNNFHLTYGIGMSSNRGIIPSTQADTSAPFMTLSLP